MRHGTAILAAMSACALLVGGARGEPRAIVWRSEGIGAQDEHAPAMPMSREAVLGVLRDAMVHPRRFVVTLSSPPDAAMRAALAKS